MKTVVLLGFSTVGKSRILNDFASKYSSKYDLETIDTDALIAQEYGEHIYNVFIKLVEDGDRNPALQYIEKREREILNSIQSSENPRLIAAGPALPSREPEWSLFMDRVSPVCFYLEKIPEEVYQGLIDRRARHLDVTEISSSPEFGSWDEDVTTEYKDGKWVELSKDRAVKNIRRHIQQLNLIYKKHSSDRRIRSNDIQNNAAIKDDFYVKLRKTLDLTE